MKHVFAPHLGQHVRLGGRRRSKANCPHFNFSRYAKAVPTAVPITVDYRAAALPALKNVFLNDSLGDCVIAGGYHVEATATGNAGKLFTATKGQLVADYRAIGGYVPGDPSTDQGADLQTAMNFWTQKGFANGTKLAGWLAIDAKNKFEVQTVIWLFENSYMGVELPDAWVTPFPSGDGFTWDVGTPNPDNGHCFIGAGYTAKGITIDTWGLFGTLTWDAVAKLCSSSDGGEIYVLLTPDIIAKASAKAPNGFDWATLTTDFNALGGHAPVPPLPTPPPAPVPPSPAAPQATLAQAQQILAAGWPKS